MDGLVCSPLGHHYNAPDLLHLGVIGRAHSIQVTCNLGTQTPALEAQRRPPCNRVEWSGVEWSGVEWAGPALSSRGEHLLAGRFSLQENIIVWFSAEFPPKCGPQGAIIRTWLELVCSATLPAFVSSTEGFTRTAASSQPFATISKDEILQLHLHLDPLLICQGWPDVIHLWPHLVNGHSVHIGVIHKPDDLVGEELSVVLGGQVPDTILVSELLIAGTALGQDAALKPTHVKQQIGVILAVNGYEAILPLHCDLRNLLTFKLPGQQIPQPAFQQWRDAPHEEQPYSPAWSPEATARTFAHRPLEEERHGWKRPLRSSSPTVNLTLPSPPLHHVPKHLIQMAFKYLQGWRLHHFPGQPVPMLDNPSSEVKFPNIQSKPPLAQPEAISSRPAVVESDEVSPQPPFLQTEQPQVPQPLPISLVLQTLPQLRCPSLDTIQPLNVSLGVGGPTLNTAFEVRPHQCRVQGHNHFPSPASHTIFDTSQDAIGFLGHLGTLLAHIQAAVSQHSQVLLCQAAFQPLFPKPAALHGVAVAQVQDLALGLVEPHTIDLGPSIQPVQVPLQSLPTLQQIDTPAQLGVICKLTEGALKPFIQIIDKDIKQNWPQHRALGTPHGPAANWNKLHSPPLFGPGHPASSLPSEEYTRPSHEQPVSPEERYSKRLLHLPGQVDMVRQVIVQIDVSNKRFKLGTSRNSHVQRLGGKESFQVKQIEIVVIHKVSEQLIGQPVQRGHHRESELPTLWLVVIEPVQHRGILLWIQFKLNRFQGLHIQDVISIIQRGFFIIKRGESHPLEGNGSSHLPRATMLLSMHN
ncbi:hypothetical protein QYF61_000977 [Mycteria americana]|uniref:Uncharacterized protein n=1 Tax=Mycteria americana TaxID=33587 RepID=A0AAN7NIB9_MYCAM|nr:hypothetical protein QYF61_000977 [Mycteria americana]